jgi:hypothetical protein
LVMVPAWLWLLTRLLETEMPNAWRHSSKERKTTTKG